MALPVLQGIAMSREPFLEGRFQYFDHPVHGSLLAGYVLLLALIVFAGRPGVSLFWTGISAAIMLLCAGKTGIIATILASLVFFGLRRQPRQAVLLLVSVAVIGSLVLAYTPVSGYLEDYSESGGVETLTGRTSLWTAVVPMILENPVLGHGYMSGKFMVLSSELESFQWGPTEAHNSFLEIAYTNGIVGLLLLLTLHYLVVKNLVVALRARQPWAAGATALYVSLFLVSLAAGSVAGKASDSFLLLLALVVLSEKLARACPAAQPVGKIA
jgi:O-antigen ligase